MVYVGVAGRYESFYVEKLCTSTYVGGMEPSQEVVATSPRWRGRYRNAVLSDLRTNLNTKGVELVLYSMEILEFC